LPLRFKKGKPGDGVETGNESEKRGGVGLNARWTSIGPFPVSVTIQNIKVVKKEGGGRK